MVPIVEFLCQPEEYDFDLRADWWVLSNYVTPLVCSFAPALTFLIVIATG